MDNQTASFEDGPTLQPVILQSVCNTTARENVSIVATRCLGNNFSNILAT